MVAYRRKVLLAVDGSDQAYEAVRYVSQLFLPNRMEVVLFHSLWEARKDSTYRHRQTFVSEWMIEQERAIQKFLERAHRLFIDRGVPEDAVSTKIKERKLGIVGDIVEECQNGYDAVVVGRQGISKLKDLVLGSIAKELIRCPINIPLCVVGGTPNVGSILIGMDVTKGAMKPLDYLKNLLDCTDCEVTFFHFISFDSATRGSDGELQKAERAANTCLQEATCHLEQAGLSRDRIITKITAGTASCPRTIVEEARDGGYGTIVVGRRSLSGLKQYLIGRVSNKVLKLAKEMAVWVVS